MPYASINFRPDRLHIDHSAVALTTDTFIEGGRGVIWDITTANAAWALAVLDYDETRSSEYPRLPEKPYIAIKCSADCSVFNVTVVANNAAGVPAVLYTFAANHSVTPIYLFLEAGFAANGRVIWQLA